jgi:cell division protein FtsL
MTDVIIKKKTKKQERFDKLKRNLKVFVLPLVTFSIFLVILLFLVVPRLRSLFTHVDDITTKNIEISKNNEKLTQLDEVYNDLPTIKAQLAEIENIANSGDTKIVEYRDRVVKLAQENGLVVRSERLNEIIEANIPDDLQSSNFISKLGLQEVPAYFEFRGSLVNLRSFLEKLDTLPDFVIVKELNFNLKDDSGADFRTQEWALEIQVVKYQFRENDQDLKDFYAGIPIDAQINSRVSEYLNVGLNETE